MSGVEALDALCEAMHDAYEAAAVDAGWQTQERSRKPWSDVPDTNKETMRRTFASLIADPGPLLEALAEAGVLRQEWSTVVGFTGRRGPETLEPLEIDPEVQTQDTRYVTEWRPTDARYELANLRAKVVQVAHEAAPFHGIAENGAYAETERLQCAITALNKWSDLAEELET